MQEGELKHLSAFAVKELFGLWHSSQHTSHYHRAHVGPQADQKEHSVPPAGCRWFDLLRSDHVIPRSQLVAGGHRDGIRPVCLVVVDPQQD